MPSPFPGMDPYLEDRNVWPDVHHSLIEAIRESLVPQVAPAYFVRLEQRAYIAEVEPPRVRRPDVAITPTEPRAKLVRESAVAATYVAGPESVSLPIFEEVEEGYLQIRDVQTHDVITVIELLSPTNKLPGAGREEYEKKRREVLRRHTSLVEIDLLRTGSPMEIDPVPKSSYYVLVRPGWQQASAELYGFGLRDPLPEFPVPLRRGETPATLHLGKLFTEVYDRARYDLSVDYSRPP